LPAIEPFSLSAVLRKKIFFLLSRVPFPLEKGDKLRAYHQLRELSHTHDIILCALTDKPVHPQAREVLSAFATHVYFFPLGKAGIIFRLLINFFCRRPFQVAYFFNKRIQRDIHKLIEKHQPDHLYCQLIRTAAYICDLPHHKTIDYQDAFSEGLRRRASVAPFYLKPLLYMEHRRVKRFESAVFEHFNEHTIISETDRASVCHPDRDRIHIIPNGVDTDYFSPRSCEKPYDLIFTGNMAYPPNVNGAVYLVKHIMPLVWKEVPEARLVLAGASPAYAVRALASEKVIVTGWVDDLRPWYCQSKVFIAPMQIGTGLQNKVLEAMAMELPCITSQLANRAIGAREGQEILIGKNTANFAQHILSLLYDLEFSKHLAISGNSFVTSHYQWSSVCRELEKVILGRK
jgi:polysaccharide biosynthesis protein PslH